REGNIYGAGLWQGKLIHRLSPSGTLVSFGDMPRYPNPITANFNTVSTSLVVDEERREILYKPENPYRIHVLDMEGTPRSVHEPDVTFGPTRVTTSARGTQFLPSDYTARFFKLHDGSYVVLTVRAHQQGNAVWQQALILDVLDPSFKHTAFVPALGFGMLMAKDDDDNLYGAIGAPTLRLIKAKLVK